MAADYGLLGGSFSIANALAAQGAGQQRQMQQRQFQRQEQEYQRQDTFRQQAQAAYDPTTGRFDPAKVRGAYAANGDIGGAVAFDKSQAEQRAAQYKAAVEQVGQTAQLLNGVTDEASYQRARAVAQQQGLDVSKVPPQYDPQWVQTMKSQALTVAQQLQEQRDRWVPIGERGLLNVSDPNAVTAFQRDQARGVYAGGQRPAQSAAPVRVTSPEQLSQLAPGTQFIAPDGSVRQIPGGAPSQGGATFP